MAFIASNGYFESTVSLDNHLHEYVYVHVSQVLLFPHICVWGCEAET